MPFNQNMRVRLSSVFNTSSNLLAVIHVILAPEAGVAEIPSLLQGEALPKSDNIGTQNYTNPVAAIITGGGYDDENFAKMKKACEGKGSVPWLRPNRSTPTPPLGPAYGKAIVERVKACFNRLVEDGKMKGDGVYFY
jgi:hypothetical protein